MYYIIIIMISIYSCTLISISIINNNSNKTNCLTIDTLPHFHVIITYCTYTFYSNVAITFVMRVTSLLNTEWNNITIDNNYTSLITLMNIAVNFIDIYYKYSWLNTSHL